MRTLQAKAHRQSRAHSAERTRRWAAQNQSDEGVGVGAALAVEDGDDRRQQEQLHVVCQIPRLNLAAQSCLSVRCVLGVLAGERQLPRHEVADVENLQHKRIIKHLFPSLDRFGKRKDFNSRVSALALVHQASLQKSCTVPSDFVWRMSPVIQSGPLPTSGNT